MDPRQQGGRYPRDPRLGHRHGISYKPHNKVGRKLNDLYTTRKGFVSLWSNNEDDTNGEFSVVLLGGSTAMGLGATKNENTIAAHLKRILLNKYEKNVRVINAACGAYASWQELLLYSLEISSFKPKWVVSISSWNDFVHSSIGNRRHGHWIKNQDRSTQDMIEQLMTGNNGGLMRKAKNYLKSLVDKQLTRIKFHKKNTRHNNFTKKELEWGYDKLEWNMRPKAADNYIHNMEQLKSIVENFGGNFIAVVQPTIDNPIKSEGALDMLRKYSLNPEMPLAQAAFYSRLEALTPRKDFIRNYQIDETYFVDHCHLNDQGQRLMASKIASDIMMLEK